MCAILIIHCAATWALAGLIWSVQLVIYPNFALVGRDAFPAFHAAHMRRISFVVGPLMLVEGATAAWLFTVGGERSPYFLTSLPLLLFHLVSTAFIQVPLHKKLEHDGFDEAVQAKLTQSNWIRTAAWSSRAILLGCLLLGSC